MAHQCNNCALGNHIGFGVARLLDENRFEILIDFDQVERLRTRTPNWQISSIRLTNNTLYMCICVQYVLTLDSIRNGCHAD